MNPDALVYSRHHSMQERDTKVFLKRFVPALDWNLSSDQVVMDIGCGSGDSILELILPSLPEVKTIIAVDVLPSMIEFAKTHNQHPKISYHTADIRNEATMKQWEGRISKVISIYCFNWIEDQFEAFTNVFKLLSQGGEAILFFALSAKFWDGYEDIVTSPKWGKYVKNANPHVPTSHTEGYRSSFYREMLEKIGFTVLTCEDEDTTFAYANDAEVRESAASRCAYTTHIPKDMLEDFKDDLFKTYLKQNGRNEKGEPLLRYTTLSLHLKKL